MRQQIPTIISLSLVLASACGKSGISDPVVDASAPPADTALPLLSPFVPTAINNAIESMVAAVAARNLASSAKPPIVVLLKDLTGYWAPIVVGANRMSTRLGCPSAAEAPVVASAKDDLSGFQCQYIQNYITAGAYRGMAFAPNTNDTIVLQAINAFIGQRGPVVTIDSDVAGTGRSYFIATANYQAGVTAANKLREALNPGDAIAVFGTTATAWVSGYQRAQGAEDGAAAAGLVVTPRIPVTWTAATDRTAIITAISDTSLNIKGLICLYANSSRCAEAVESAGKKGQIQIVGFDMEADTKAYFDKGYFYGIAVQRQYYMGQLGVLVPYAIDVLGAEQTADLLKPLLVDGSLIDTGIDIITPANYADYMTFLSTLGINV